MYLLSPQPLMQSPCYTPLLLDPHSWNLFLGFTQELKDHDAVNILKQLPLLNAMQEEPSGGIPLIGSLVNSILKYIVW